MSKQCVEESWPAAREEVLLWGNTHVFLMLDGSKELEVIRKKKMQAKIDAANLL